MFTSYRTKEMEPYMLVRTSNLKQRVWQHKNNIFLGFSNYCLNQLVYYEEHINITEIVRRERRLKNWCREWKLNLIEGFNPTWRDLYELVCV